MLKASEKTDKSDDSPVTIADYGEPFASYVACSACSFNLSSNLRRQICCNGAIVSSAHVMYCEALRYNGSYTSRMP